MMNKIVIIGASDLGKSIAHHATTAGLKVVGFYDDTMPVNKMIDDVPVLGPIDQINDDYKKNVFDGFFVGIGYNHMEFRKKIFERISNAGIPAAILIHPSAYVDRNAIL